MREKSLTAFYNFLPFARQVRVRRSREKNRERERQRERESTKDDTQKERRKSRHDLLFTLSVD